MKIVIESKDLKKYFIIPSEKNKSLKRTIINLLLGKHNKYFVKAVDGVNLKINEGEFIGITGRNGSGKSTLLKLIAGVMTPQQGKLNVNGSISPFLELGAGFCKELSATQNIYLYGALLGIPKDKITKKIPNILKFAELEKFKNAKIGGFSSGMRSRLGFATAMQLDSDIFLVDEALAVGDIKFKHKCFEAFENVKKRKKTVLFVSHDMYSLERFCDKLILMDKGKIIEIGRPKNIIKKYALHEIKKKKNIREERRRIKHHEGIFS